MSSHDGNYRNYIAGLDAKKTLLLADAVQPAQTDLPTILITSPKHEVFHVSSSYHYCQTWPAAGQNESLLCTSLCLDHNGTLPSLFTFFAY